MQRLPVAFAALRRRVRPIAEALFARLSAKHAREPVDARVLTVTLDPDNDPPTVMANIARTARLAAC